MARCPVPNGQMMDAGYVYDPVAFPPPNPFPTVYGVINSTKYDGGDGPWVPPPPSGSYPSSTA